MRISMHTNGITWYKLSIQALMAIIQWIEYCCVYSNVLQ